MQKETVEQVAILRAKVADAQKQLDAVKTVLAGNTDEYINGLVRQAGFWLEDVETHFIGMLEEDRGIPRTLGEERNILGFANHHVSAITMPLIHQLTDMVKKYGAKVTSVGGR